MNNINNIINSTLEHFTNFTNFNIICDNIEGTKVNIDGKFDEILPKNSNIKASDIFKKFIEEIKTIKNTPPEILKDGSGVIQLLLLNFLPMIFKISPSRICNIRSSIDYNNLSETSPFSISFIVTDKKDSDNQHSGQRLNFTYNYLSHNCIAEWMTYEINKATALTNLVTNLISFPKSLESSKCKVLSIPPSVNIVSNENNPRISNVCINVLPNGRVRAPPGVDISILPDGRVLDENGMTLLPCVNVPSYGRTPTISPSAIISPRYTEDFTATTKPIPDAKIEQKIDQEKDKEKEKPPPESNTWLYVVIGIVFLTLAIGGGIWYMNRPSQVSSKKMDGGIFNIGE